MDQKEQKIEIDHGSIEVEHDIDFLTLFFLGFVLWAPCWWYDAEIRCALGNQKVCATLAVQPAKPPQQ
jgi:hypothetical protein